MPIDNYFRCKSEHGISSILRIKIKLTIPFSIRNNPQLVNIVFRKVPKLKYISRGQRI